MQKQVRPVILFIMLISFQITELIVSQSVDLKVSYVILASLRRMHTHL